MKTLNIELHNEEFDVEVQYCNVLDCQYDCTTNVTNQCNAVFTGLN